jgi:ABC-type lipoprotein export system ATPase subunit
MSDQDSQRAPQGPPPVKPLKKSAENGAPPETGGQPAAPAQQPGGVAAVPGGRAAAPNIPPRQPPAGTGVPAPGTAAQPPQAAPPANGGPGYPNPLPQPHPPAAATIGPGYQPSIVRPQALPTAPGYAVPGLPPAPVGYQVPPGYAPAGMPPRPGIARPTIAVRNLHHTFPGGTFRLSVPTLDIMPGELTYIGGASGSGKSTLIKFLALETVPDGGDIYMLDRLIRMLPEKDLDDLRGGGLTYIPQGHLGLIDNTAIQNIQRVLYDYDGVPWTQAERQAQHALQTVGLDAQNHKQKVKLLSGGQQARVAIAKVFARGRPICLADEILPALDDKSRHDVLRLLQQLARGGFTVAIIAHQPELKPYFHRVIEMQAGQIVGDQRQAPKPL